MLFCYFDSDEKIDNIRQSVRAGIRIVLTELEHNSNSVDAMKVRKQVLVGCGEAYVGNIGGRDSSIEITAMGTPVNFLSRLETLVKSKKMRSLLPENHIIVSAEVFNHLDLSEIDLEFIQHDLRDYNMTVKDFEETHIFYTLEASEDSYQKLEI